MPENGRWDFIRRLKVKGPFFLKKSDCANMADQREEGS